MNETLAGHTDDRIVRESGIDARIASIVVPVLAAIGFRLVRVRLTGQNGLTLQVMAERLDGSMSVEDCETVSRALSPALDVEDPIEKAYNLEVSSPGIDRPLVRVADFAAWKDHQAKLETSVLVGGKKRFRGRIAEIRDDGVVIETAPSADNDNEGEAETAATEIPFEAIAEARLVLTDDLIRDALKKDKKLRQEAKKRRGRNEPAEKTEEIN